MLAILAGSFACVRGKVPTLLNFRGAARCGFFVLGLLLLAGCTARHYRKSADKETYAIVQQMEQRVFGHTNDFTINTRYSGRDPKTIPPAEILDDRSTSSRLVINLNQALVLAVQNSRDYQAEKELLYLRALELSGARYAFSPQFVATTSPQISGTPDNPAEFSAPRTRLGVSQLLTTGGKLTASLVNDLVWYLTGKPATQARSSAVNILSVNLEQPLLRGFGINSPEVEALTQAERNVVYAVRSFSRYQQQFAVDTVNDYFSLLTQKDIVRNNYRNYTNRVETTQYLTARAIDRERMSSADDARTAELNAKTAYINTLASYLSALDAFKLRLGIPLSTRLFLEDKDLQELIGAGLVTAEINPDAAFRICVEKQMDVLNSIDAFEDSKRKVRIAADQLRADVNFFAGGSLQSEGPPDYVHFDPNKLQYNAGVTLNLPVDRLLQRNAYRRTLVSFESQLRSLSLTLDNYRDRIDRGLRSVEQTRLNYLSAAEALKVAQRRVENNVMLMEAGRATVRDVREAQDGLIQAQNDLASIYADYLRTRMNLLLNIGVIDTRPEKFWLLDPLQDKLTPAERGASPLRMPDDHVLPPDNFFDPTS